MDAIEHLAGGARTGTGSKVGSNGLGSLSSEEFTKIILQELSAQDPLQPNDTSALLEQIGTIRRIESDTSITDKLSDLVGQNEFAAAAGLIGRRVSGLTDTFERVEDVVVSVVKTNDGPVLTLAAGQRMAFGDLDEVARLESDEEVTE